MFYVWTKNTILTVLSVLYRENWPWSLYFPVQNVKTVSIVIVSTISVRLNEFVYEIIVSLLYVLSKRTFYKKLKCKSRLQRDQPINIFKLQNRSGLSPILYTQYFIFSVHITNWTSKINFKSSILNGLTGEFQNDYCIKIKEI